MAEEKQLTFEQAMSRLEKIVERLEAGEISLEESMKLFGEGTALMKQCTELLDKAEQQVTRLVSQETGAEVPFTPEGD